MCGIVGNINFNNTGYGDRIYQKMQSSIKEGDLTRTEYINN